MSANDIALMGHLMRRAGFGANSLGGISPACDEGLGVDPIGQLVEVVVHRARLERGLEHLHVVLEHGVERFEPAPG